MTQAGIPAVPSMVGARIYVDQSKGHGTGVALANINSTPITVNIQILSSTGVTGSRQRLTIPANGHKAAFIDELIAGLPAGFTGIADITTEGLMPIAPLTLRSLVNGRGDFLLTTFPATNRSEGVTTPAPTGPMVFPQFADGAGYATEFIFISTSGSATMELEFRGDDGTPLFVGRSQVQP